MTLLNCPQYCCYHELWLHGSLKIIDDQKVRVRTCSEFDPRQEYIQQREHSKAMSCYRGGWERRFKPQLGTTTDFYGYIHPLIKQLLGFLNLSVGCPIRKIKEATRGSPLFTSDAILFTMCSSLSEVPLLLDFFYIKNHNKNALFAQWVVFICFHSFYVAFIEITEIPQMPLLEPARLWFPTADPEFLRIIFSHSYLSSKSTRLNSVCVHLAVLKVRLNALFIPHVHSFGEKFKQLNVAKVW